MAVLYSCVITSHNFFINGNFLNPRVNLVDSGKELILENLVYSSYTNLF